MPRFVFPDREPQAWCNEAWTDSNGPEMHRIVNEPGMTWKVRRALLREKLGVPEDVIKMLVPENDPASY